MTRFETAQVTVAYRDRCEDRVKVFDSDNRTVIVVADGAGGIGQGAEAAEAVVREVSDCYEAIATVEQWESQLRQIDCRIGAGQSTAVVVDLRPESTIGASVGDSRAWIVHDGETLDLTRDQVRKPLLGTGESQPRAFAHGALTGMLLVATDGFTNYVKRDSLTRLVAQCDFVELPRRCIELVRLPSGELWDDIGIVVCRARPPVRTRKRYEI